MQIHDVAIIPLIVGVTELGKKLGLPAKFSPILSAGLGIAAGMVYVAPEDPAKAVLVGLSLGLGACGLYSGVKNVSEGLKG